MRSPFFCSSLECTVLLTSSCSTRARWIKEVLVRQCFAFALCYAPQARLAMFGRSTNFFSMAAHTPYTWPLPAVQGKMVLTRQSFKSQGSFWPSCNKGYVIYRLLPCLFTGPKMFWAGPNFLCPTKNLFTYCGSHRHFVPDKKMICIQ